MNTLDTELNKVKQPKNMYEIRLKTKRGELVKRFRVLKRAEVVWQKLYNEGFEASLFDPKGNLIPMNGKK